MVELTFDQLYQPSLGSLQPLGLLQPDQLFDGCDERRTHSENDCCCCMNLNSSHHCERDPYTLLTLLFQPPLGFDQLFDQLLVGFDQLSQLPPPDLHWISEPQLYFLQVSSAVGFPFWICLQQCSLLEPVHCAYDSSPSEALMTAKPKRARKINLILDDLIGLIKEASGVAICH